MQLVSTWNHHEIIQPSFSMVNPLECLVAPHAWTLKMDIVFFFAQGTCEAFQKGWAGLVPLIWCFWTVRQFYKVKSLLWFFATVPNVYRLKIMIMCCKSFPETAEPSEPSLANSMNVIHFSKFSKQTRIFQIELPLPIYRIHGMAYIYLHLVVSFMWTNSR